MNAAVSKKESRDLLDPGVRWLLACEEPAVRTLTRTELLDQPHSAADVRSERRQVLHGPWVQALLEGQAPDGGFGVHPYQKWRGAHWRLVSLVELGIPPGEPRGLQAAEQVLAWLLNPSRLRRVPVIEGRARRCASQEGNALAVCVRLGIAEDPRVQRLAELLVGWQWPDGGWNCDKRPQAAHASFYETLAPLWGLIEYEKVTADDEARAAAERAVEFFLRHHLFRSERSSEPIDPEWTKLHYPLYWHYDILQALLILSRFRPLDDPRMAEALDLLASKRRPDGRWLPEGYYWRPPGRSGSNVEVLDWGRRGPNVMITLNALRVLRAAGRWEPAAAAQATA